MECKINAIILASGFSRRMGCDKLTLPFRDTSIIENVVGEILKIDFNEVIMVYRSESVRKAVEGKSIRFIENKEADNGMSESIKVGVRNSSECDAYMFFVGDQINLKEELILKLIFAFKNKRSSIIVPLYDGNRGNPTIFPCEFKEEFLNLSGDKGGRIILNKYPERISFVEVEDEELGFDVDTKEDYFNILKGKGKI